MSCADATLRVFPISVFICLTSLSLTREHRTGQRKTWSTLPKWEWWWKYFSLSLFLFLSSQIAHVIREVRMFQQMPYKIESSEKVRRWLLDPGIRLCDDELYHRSLTIEPRTSRLSVSYPVHVGPLIGFHSHNTKPWSWILYPGVKCCVQCPGNTSIIGERIAYKVTTSNDDINNFKMIIISKNDVILSFLFVEHVVNKYLFQNEYNVINIVISMLWM